MFEVTLQDVRNYREFQAAFGPVEATIMPFVRKLNESSDTIDRWLFGLTLTYDHFPGLREDAYGVMEKLASLRPLDIEDVLTLKNLLAYAERRVA